MKPRCFNCRYGLTSRACCRSDRWRQMPPSCQIPRAARASSGGIANYIPILCYRWYARRRCSRICTEDSLSYQKRTGVGGGGTTLRDPKKLPFNSGRWYLYKESISVEIFQQLIHQVKSTTRPKGDGQDMNAGS